MSAKISLVETYKTMLDTALSSFNEEAIKFLGEDAKLYLSKAYTTGAKMWIRALKDKYGLEINKNVKTPKEAVESYIQLGIEGGMFSSKDDFLVEDIKEGCAVRIKVVKCPHVFACKMVRKDMELSAAQIPCIRMACFKGGVEYLLNIKCGYRVYQVEEDYCEGVIFSLEEECQDKVWEFIHC